MNRYTELSTSTYKPLDLNEILMVPLQKQQQHDQAQAAADEYAALTAKRLAQDAGPVDTRLGELRSSADAISQDLLSHGVSRNNMAQIHALKREKEKEFSQQGLIGNAQANYEIATKFVNDLAEKKERQAGWSPENARSWAQSQVTGFKGTLDDSGGFRQLQPKELDDYVDPIEWIDKRLEKVAADTGVLGLGKYGNINQFTSAWKSGTVEHKDREKIIKALQLQAQYDPKLQASLRQSAFWTGEKNPNSIGDWQIVKDKNGRSVEVFKPTSSFGYQLAGAAHGAQYRKETQQYSFPKDDMAFELWKKGLDKNEAENLVTATTGLLSNVPPAKYEELQNSLSLAQKEVAHSALKLNALADNIRNRKEAGANTDPFKDPAYQAMLAQHNESKARYSNAQFNLENIIKNANPNMNAGERTMLQQNAIVSGQINRIKENAPTIGEGLKGVFVGENKIKDYYLKSFASLGITEQDLKNKGIDTSTNSLRMLARDNSNLLKGLIMQKNGALNKNLTANQLIGKVEHINQRDKLSQKNAQNYIKDHPAAQDYQVFDGSASGAFKSVVGGYQKQMTDTFTKNNGGGWNIANGGPSLNAAIAKATEESDGKGVSFEVMPTTGVDDMGYPIEQLVITNKGTGEKTPYSVTRGEAGRSTQREVGKALARNPEFAESGSRMTKNAEFLPDVQALGIHQDSYKGKVIPGMMVDGKYVYVDKEYLKDARVPGAKGSVGNEAVYRVKLIDPKKWNANHEAVGDQVSGSLGGVNDIIDVIYKMKYNQ